MGNINPNDIMYLRGYLNEMKKKNGPGWVGSQTVLPEWMVVLAGSMFTWGCRQGFVGEQGLRLCSVISQGHKLCLRLGDTADWAL